MSDSAQHRPVVVQKYGGSSVADAGKVRRIAQKICERRASGVNMVVVVSAMGDSTDDLIALAKAVTGPDHIPAPREMDTLLSTGELVTSTLMAMAINSFGQSVVSLSGQQAGIRTDDIHGSARIASINTERLWRELDAGNVVIVAGFQGLAESGDVTTLGRGGSDTTAVALAAALDGVRCEIYTDVDGIYTTDPRLVPQARKLKEIGYEEMLEMASLGAKMNPRSIELAAVYGVPVLVASTFQDLPGTLIHGGEPTMELRKAVTGIAVDRNVAKITVRGVQDRPGVAAGLLKPLADSGISVDVIVQNTSDDGTTDFTFTVAEAEAQRALEQVKAQGEVKFREATAGTGLAKVSVVGTGMQNAPGYAATMFASLAGAAVNIDMITTSEIRITCIVKKEDVQKATQALHAAFELEKAE
jgi:aspartate kinase